MEENGEGRGREGEENLSFLLVRGQVLGRESLFLFVSATNQPLTKKLLII